MAEKHAHTAASALPLRLICYCLPQTCANGSAGSLGSHAGSNGGARTVSVRHFRHRRSPEGIGELRSSAPDETFSMSQMNRSGTPFVVRHDPRNAENGDPVRTILQDMLTNLQAVTNLTRISFVQENACDMEYPRDEPASSLVIRKVELSLSWLPKVIFAHASGSVLTAGSPVAGFHPDPGVPCCSMRKWPHAISFPPLMVRQIRIGEIPPCILIKEQLDVK